MLQTVKFFSFILHRVNIHSLKKGKPNYEYQKPCSYKRKLSTESPVSLRRHLPGKRSKANWV